MKNQFVKKKGKVAWRKYLPGYQSPVRFLLVGVGGTGSYVFYYLSRLVAAQKENSQNGIDLDKYQILIADGDIVEEKNLVRQNYIRTDLGKHKAEVLSERYGTAYNISIPFYANYIEEMDVLKNLLFERIHGVTPRLSVLISCVDNNRSRQLFHEAFNSNYPLVYIDSGNDEWSGQVFCGINDYDKIILPPVGAFYPDILEDNTSIFPSELSCEERQVSSPQNMATNIMAATLVFTIINQLIFGEGLEICGATFNAKTGLVRPVWVDDPAIKKIKKHYKAVRKL